MSRRKCPHNRTDVRRAICWIESLGKKVTAVNFHPDGSFGVMTKDHKDKSDAHPTNALDDWKAKKNASAS
jgi:hypothetical protein